MRHRAAPGKTASFIAQDTARNTVVRTPEHDACAASPQVAGCSSLSASVVPADHRIGLHAEDVIRAAKCLPLTPPRNTASSAQPVQQEGSDISPERRGRQPSQLPGAGGASAKACPPALPAGGRQASPPRYAADQAAYVYDVSAVSRERRHDVMQRMQRTWLPGGCQPAAQAVARHCRLTWQWRDPPARIASHTPESQRERHRSPYRVPAALQPWHTTACLAGHAAGPCRQQPATPAARLPATAAPRCRAAARAAPTGARQPGRAVWMCRHIRCTPWMACSMCTRFCPPSSIPAHRLAMRPGPGRGQLGRPLDGSRLPAACSCRQGRCLACAWWEMMRPRQGWQGVVCGRPWRLLTTRQLSGSCGRQEGLQAQRGGSWAGQLRWPALLGQWQACLHPSARQWSPRRSRGSWCHAPHGCPPSLHTASLMAATRQRCCSPPSRQRMLAHRHRRPPLWQPRAACGSGLPSSWPPGWCVAWQPQSGSCSARVSRS
jgi:hypothetical protein